MIVLRRSVAVIAAFVLLAGLAVTAEPTPSYATSGVRFGVGTNTLATPAEGGSYLTVTRSGSGIEGGDTFSTVQLAIRAARPGDVIVVRGGTYTEAIGWGLTPASSTRPIVLQAYPGESVVIAGTLIMKNADYWTIQGMRFLHTRSIQGSGQSIVVMSGGTGWKLINNEIAGSPGVANVIVNSMSPSNTSTSARQAAAPQNFTIAGNCIRSNVGTGTHGTFHNVYVMSTLFSSGGTIERNLLAGAPRGANIKMAAAGSSSANQSPNNLLVKNNTSLYAASGFTLGLATQNVLMQNNLVAAPSNSQRYDGGVKTYQMTKAGTNAYKDGIISGYRTAVRKDAGVKWNIFTARIASPTIALTGSVTTCSVKAADPAIASRYGHLAN